MDYRVILIVPLVAIAGFVLLEKALRSTWSSPMDRKEGPHEGFSEGLRLDHPLPHGDCYDGCMSDAHWDSAVVPACVAACGL